MVGPDEPIEVREFPEPELEPGAALLPTEEPQGQEGKKRL
jgi:hypothetical protein